MLLLLATSHLDGRHSTKIIGGLTKTVYGSCNGAYKKTVDTSVTTISHLLRAAICRITLRVVVSTPLANNESAFKSPLGTKFPHATARTLSFRGRFNRKDCSSR